MMRGFAIFLIAAISLRAIALAQTESTTVDLALPTDNDALFSGGGADFYQVIERDYHGEKSMPWEGGQYGFVRDPEQTSAGIMYTRFHEGIDIKPLHRDENGEPLDEIRAIADGKVVHTAAVAGYSNYGRYIVIEHNFGGSPYYSLYGHLSKIDVRVGDIVHRGQHIAVMGYTGVGINRERAHVHLELNLMMNHKFQQWYDAVHPHDPNHHGIYNGINLAGMNIAKLYLALHENPSLTIPEFLGKEEVYFKVAFPKSRSFELPKLYPWMVKGSGDAKSWTVSFARSGLPLRIEPSSRSVKQIEIVYVKPSKVNASYMTNGIATGPTSSAHLTEFGQQTLRLLIYPE